MKTKKVVKRKFNFKKFLILILLVYLVINGTYYLLKRPVKNIIITGNKEVKDYEIIEAANLKNYPSFISINKSKITKTLKQNPFIKDVQIKKNFKFQITINVTEEKVVAYNLTNQSYLLSNGTYINDKNFLGVPQLNNYTPEDVLKNFAEELGKLDEDIIADISEIEYSPSKNETGETIDSNRFKLKMKDGNTVYINVKKCNVLSYYNQIYASLKDKKGVLNLDSGNYERYVLTLYEE